MAKNGVLHTNETRDRVLEAAGRLFAERGFNHVSIRDICEEAGSNVASVNYHFGDKLGLYRELIGAVAEGMHRAKVAALEAGAEQTPEERLRAYIRHFLHQLFDTNGEEDSWMEKLIAREMMEPTPALDLFIEKGLKPAAQGLSTLVGQIVGLPADDWRVQASVGAIQGLCIWYRSSRAVIERWGTGLRFTPEVVDGLADFVANFSLAGVRAVAREQEGREARAGAERGSATS